jgi:hypothetical protein
MIKESYPNSCILWLDEVKNPELENRYQNYVACLQAQGDPVKESLLFHGTKEHIISHIVNVGFESSRNVTSAYGKGTYFAKNANYSKNYSTTSNDDISFMIISKVALCKGCQGKANQNIDQARFDHAFDSQQNPSIYVIPNDSAALPVYVVAFHKNAS